MRATIELTDEQRAGLLALAARRGQRGFSALVREAIDRYLDAEMAREGRVQRALALAGTFSADAADALEASVRQLRRSCR